MITSFSASPGSVAIGVASTLTWSVSGAGTVSIDHGVGTVASSGSRTVLPTTTTVYTLTATNANGANMAATQIVVSDGYACAFTHLQPACDQLFHV